jgi:hypothetical protein
MVSFVFASAAPASTGTRPRHCSQTILMIRRRSSTVKRVNSPGRAVGVQPVHAALDQPVDVAAQLASLISPRASSGTMFGVKMPFSCAMSLLQVCI